MVMGGFGGKWGCAFGMWYVGMVSLVDEGYEGRRIRECRLFVQIGPEKNSH